LGEGTDDADKDSPQGLDGEGRLKHWNFYDFAHYFDRRDANDYSISCGMYPGSCNGQFASGGNGYEWNHHH